MSVPAVTQPFCEPVLQSNTEQWGMYVALTSAAVPECCITAQVYQEEMSISVSAVTQACCEPVLQSNTEQCGMHFALTSAAVPECCITAHLY